MPSRQPPPAPPLPEFPTSQPPPFQYHNHHHPHHRYHHFLISLLAITAATSALIFILLIFYRKKLSKKRTAPSDLKPPHKFSFLDLRRATSSFSASNRLGQGGFGSVYKATLSSDQNVAVKLMDSGSLQGEREFNNELSLSSKITNSEHVVSLLGFSSDRKRRRLVLVYELMVNGSLQDALLHRKCIELMDWGKRFKIAIDIAKSLDYLHNCCLVIHGDIKPSNILLDGEFNAKIADFGLARCVAEEDEEILKENKVHKIQDDNGSIMEETESVITGFEEEMVMPDQSPESFSRVTDADTMTSPEMVVMASPSEGLDKTSVSESYFDKLSVDSGKELIGSRINCGKKNGGSGRDWWWKQDNGGCGGGGDVVAKDYVMEWIGNEIKKERPKSDWIASSSSKVENGNGSSSKTENNKKHKKRLEWWNSLDEENVKKKKKKEKARKPREWWKEEFCEELSKKKKKKRELKSSNGDDNWWNGDNDLTTPERKKRKSRGSRSSIDWWLDGLSGELRSGRRNSQDWASGDIPKSGGVSSTPSMRGTVCYIAPEYGGGGQLSEKCDVYSYGVLVLVLISGRRPLQVTASPMSEFERANLISWARQLARNGKLLDLIDSSIHSLDREQALLCITIALLCLQRSPGKRPTMKEIVGMLSGESEPPTLPFDFSPSPPSGFPFKSRKKAR